MRTSFSIALALALAACGGKSKPDTTTTTTDDTSKTPDETPAMVTPEECESTGGTVAWDIGDGSVACPEGTAKASNVSGGVEAGLCCKPAGAEGAPAPGAAEAP
ncbi:MAG TPA: hypothetical protein VM261_14595 [Kofleriaceae bacterium]|nr:hypothetical protein [Kofleriaceae bacterium]